MSNVVRHEASQAKYKVQKMFTKLLEVFLIC